VALNEFGSDRSPARIELKMSATRTVLERNFQAVRAYGATALNMCHIAAGHFEVYVVSF